MATRDSGDVIEMSGLVKNFGDITAVDSLDLSVKQGEIFGLIGPDGAGKTTTIRILATVLTPTRGHAAVMGYDTVRHSEEIKRHVGYMAQQFNMYRDLTVMENLEFFANVHGMPKIRRRERIDQLLQFARLTEFTDRWAGRLSGGMKKKLALACALVHEPDVLLLDEPTTGVDPISRREFWDILADLHIQGTTIFVSTPYMDEAERCSRVGLMYDGRLLQCDSPPSLQRQITGELLELRPVSTTIWGVGLLRQAESVVRRLPGVQDVQAYGDLLHIFVDRVDIRQADIVAALAQAQIHAQDLRVTRPRMEEVFISFVQRAIALGTADRSAPDPDGSAR